MDQNDTFIGRQAAASKSAAFTPQAMESKADVPPSLANPTQRPCPIMVADFAQLAAYASLACLLKQHSGIACLAVWDDRPRVTVVTVVMG